MIKSDQKKDCLFSILGTCLLLSLTLILRAMPVHAEEPAVETSAAAADQASAKSEANRGSLPVQSKDLAAFHAQVGKELFPSSSSLNFSSPVASVKTNITAAAENTESAAPAASNKLSFAANSGAELEKAEGIKPAEAVKHAADSELEAGEPMNSEEAIKMLRSEMGIDSGDGTGKLDKKVEAKIPAGKIEPPAFKTELRGTDKKIDAPVLPSETVKAQPSEPVVTAVPAPEAAKPSAAAEVVTPQPVPASKPVSSKQARVEIGNKEKFYTVYRVYNGDVLRLTNDERVVLIGVDTPEPYLSDKLFNEARESGYKIDEVRKAGRIAMRFTKKLAEGQKVRFEFDEQPRDNHGQLYAYVFLSDGTFLNAELIRAGYARAVNRGGNLKYRNLFLNLEKEARQNRRGFWANWKPSAPKPPATNYSL